MKRVNDHRSSSGETASPAQTPLIEFQHTAPPGHRDELKQALEAALAREAGRWHIRVSSKLVYLTPSAGLWWFKVRLTSPEGETFTAQLDPDHLTHAAVIRAVADALTRKPV